jgi:hypothetical protein
MIIISDIDFTIADSSHRTHYIDRDNPDWISFYSPSEVIRDKVIEPVKYILDTIHYHQESFSDDVDVEPIRVVFSTSRQKLASSITHVWLQQNDIEYYDIYFRDDGDERPCAEVKLDNLKKIKKDFSKEKILFVLEDNESCVRMYRDNNLFVLQCEELYTFKKEHQHA